MGRAQRSNAVGRVVAESITSAFPSGPYDDSKSEEWNRGAMDGLRAGLDGK